MDDCDFLIKIVLVGDERTGKSAFLARFADDEFVSEYVTTAGVDFKIRLMTVDDRKIKFQIWDVSDKFSVLDRSQGGNYRGAHGIMLIYDSTNSNSFESLKSKWLREATQHASSQTIKMIVATKCDLPSTVSSSRLRTFCESIGATYMETSAKTGSNVDGERSFLRAIVVMHFLQRHSFSWLENICDCTQRYRRLY
jgi:Ras-related protein Rab-1A